MKNAFVLSDAKKVSSAAQKLLRSVSDLDLSALSDDKRRKWSDYSGKLTEQVDQITKSRDIEEQRGFFVNLNDQFLQIVKVFAMPGKTVYLQFCPMANNNSGAYWLSETEDIRNPYFGDAMLTCGETKEVIK